MASSKENFQRNFKRLLFEKDISCVEVSKKLNVAATTVRKWKQGEIFPRAKTLDKIAKFFRITVTDLLNDNKQVITHYSIPLHNEFAEYDNLNSENRKKVIEFIHFLRANEGMNNK